MTNASGDRIPEVGEVWASASTSVRWTVVAVLDDHYVWIQYTDRPNDTPQTVTVGWMNGGLLVPPRKVSREIQLIRTTKGGVWSGSMTAEPMPGERTIGTVVVYDDNTIEVKNATD